MFITTTRASRRPTPRQPCKKWHEQFVQPRYVDLFANVPTYWEKDDHDCRYDDCDNTGDRLPSPQLGIATFREQVPVVDPLDDDAVTYRTHRIGRLAQIWLLEGRDYRSPNDSPDGPDKTLWGAEQLAWLKRTLSESDAVFKFIISPTPLVGPDDRRKTDNHTDIGGFQHEGQAFYDWLSENGFLDRGLYFICGDRHWQYHSIHPSGFEEFSTGALVDANSRLGVKPGDEDGTDPDALIRQPYTSDPPSGGFLLVDVAEGSDGPRAAFEFFDENGKLLHRVVREAPMDTTR
ncbi:MAG: alkaline phosphatase D family protein [Pirellulales bacterium]